MRLYGGGLQYSDTVWVGDVARVFVLALEAAEAGRVPPFPVDVGNRSPYRVLDVALAVAEAVPGARTVAVPMRAGEPEGGPLSAPEGLERVARAVLGAEPGLEPVYVRRAVKQLGTVVSADPDTLTFLDIDPEGFTPLQEGIDATVEWFRANEGLTWQSRG